MITSSDLEYLGMPLNIAQDFVFQTREGKEIEMYSAGCKEIR